MGGTAGTPVAALRLAGLASGGTPEAAAALDAAFAATSFLLDDFYHARPGAPARLGGRDTIVFRRTDVRWRVIGRWQ